jgi:hypothetical protein
MLLQLLNESLSDGLLDLTLLDKNMRIGKATTEEEYKRRYFINSKAFWALKPSQNYSINFFSLKNYIFY